LETIHFEQETASFIRNKHEFYLDDKSRSSELVTTHVIFRISVWTHCTTDGVIYCLGGPLLWPGADPVEILGQSLP